MYVYLDTNIYKQCNYDFTGSMLKDISEYLNQDFLYLLVNYALIGEVKSHIRTDMVKAVKDFNRVLGLYGDYFFEESSNSFEPLVEETVIKKMEKAFDAFLSSPNVIDTCVNDICVEELLQMFFEQQLPFEPGKRKEFKDAIMILSLKNYRSKIDEDICIVSQDEGFRKTLKSLDDFVLFPSLINFLDYCQKEKAQEDPVLRNQCIEISKLLHKYIQNEEYTASIKEYIYNMNYSIDTFDECEDSTFSIDEISYTSTYTTFENDRIISYFIVKAKLSVEAKYIDTNRSYYDKEDDTFSFVSRYSTVEEHVIVFELPIAFTTSTNENDIIISDFEILSERKYPSFVLSKDTCIRSSRKYLSDD